MQQPTPSAHIDVSIIIVNYNVRDFLLQCLESIFRSRSHVTMEVIVVDNASHDQSIELLKPRFANVEFVGLTENIGFGRANNVGIEQARGTYTLLLNPDTIIQEDTLEVMFRYMEEHPTTGVSGCKVLNADGSFQVQCRRGFPSPWASFCKLFGLQSLFPRSPLFARYNQTFRSEDETYNVDAVIGAFMFCRTEALRVIGGFDPDFFMYGEDLDVCFRMANAGFPTAYVASTTIVHFKGESTRRSSINEVKVFYDAMQIFARKHFASSHIFLLFLKSGIYLRSILAYLLRYKRSLLVMLCDLVSVILTFLLAVRLRRGDFFALPEYAFPIVFIVLPLVVLISMIMVGEYFEYKPTIRRAVVALLISFFILSSLTYYWNEYAFSRGVLLMTIGFSVIAAVGTRALFAFTDKLFGEESDRRIILVGTRAMAEEAARRLQKENAIGVHVVGYVSRHEEADVTSDGIPLLGHEDYLVKIVDQFQIDEVIVLGAERNNATMIANMKAASGLGVRFHFATDSTMVVALGIAERISEKGTATAPYRILSLRAKVFKRIMDIVSSVAALFILSALVILAKRNARQLLKSWFEVFRGSKSVVGLYGQHQGLENVAKEGVTGLAHISAPQMLSAETIHDLNEYYIKNYSPSLDIDICIKSIFSNR